MVFVQKWCELYFTVNRLVCVLFFFVLFLGAKTEGYNSIYFYEYPTRMKTWNTPLILYDIRIAYGSPLLAHYVMKLFQRINIYIQFDFISNVAEVKCLRLIENRWYNIVVKHILRLKKKKTEKNECSLYVVRDHLFRKTKESVQLIKEF